MCKGVKEVVSFDMEGKTIQEYGDALSDYRLSLIHTIKLNFSKLNLQVSRVKTNTPLMYFDDMRGKISVTNSRQFLGEINYDTLSELEQQLLQEQSLFYLQLFQVSYLLGAIDFKTGTSLSNSWNIENLVRFQTIGYKNTIYTNLPLINKKHRMTCEGGHAVLCVEYHKNMGLKLYHGVLIFGFHGIVYNT